MLRQANKLLGILGEIEKYRLVAKEHHKNKAVEVEEEKTNKAEKKVNYLKKDFFGSIYLYSFDWFYIC